MDEPFAEQMVSEVLMPPIAPPLHLVTEDDTVPLLARADEYQQEPAVEGPPAPDVPAMPEQRYTTDAIGRQYPIDEYGFRIYKRGNRPTAFPPEKWNTLSALIQHEFWLSGKQ